MKRPYRLVLTAAALIGGLLLTGCGDSSDHSGHAQPSASDSSGGHEGHSGMNDDEVPRADEIEGANLSSGEFELLDTRPDGHDKVAGTAWLAQHDGGITVTAELTGLKPGTSYDSHLHAQDCSDDNGGPHFQFDPDAGTSPPNEVHLSLKADDDGNVVATVENENTGADGAKSLVVHLSEDMDARVVCAQF